MKVIPDTNVFMEGVDPLLYEKIMVLPSVFGELDKLNHCDDSNVSYHARKAIKKIHEDILDYPGVMVLNGKEDSCFSSKHFVDSTYCGTGDQSIVSDLLHYRCNYPDMNNYIFITYDVALTVVLDSLGFDYQLLKKRPEPIYKGYKEVKMSNQEMADFYSDIHKNIGLKTNEYLLMRNSDGEIVDYMRWDGEKFCGLEYKKIKSDYFGTVSPADDDFTQKFVFDSLFSDKITVLFGKAGAGKTFLPLAYAMQQLQNNKIRKLYIVHSFEPLKNAKTLGFLPGEKIDKMLGSGLGAILSTKLGGLEVVRDLIARNKLEIIPTSDIRGVEFGAEDMVFMTEAQNTDAYTMKTLLQRCVEGCKIIIEGDMLEQVDIRETENGMKKLINVFAGSEYFTCIKMKMNHRNPISELAENIF